jgi:integrase
MEFTIMTATRSTEARLAEWKEIDWDARLWTIPSARMKGRKLKRTSHTVPLNARAIAILRELQARRSGDLIFPGWVDGRALSGAACGKVLELMGRTETLHGFRTSFRTWASEETDYAREICEKALSHTIGSDVERAYDRGDLLKKRRGLMQAWADFCLPPAARLVNVA